MKSNLSEHYVVKGIVKSPWNYHLGDLFSLTSWHKDRFPHYAWIALLWTEENRSKVLNGVCKAMLQSLTIKNLNSISIEDVLKLPHDTQKKIYTQLHKEMDCTKLCALSLVLNQETSPVFFEYFYRSEYGISDRINMLKVSVNNCADHQSYASTDIRYLIVWSMAMSGKLKVSDYLTRDAINHYPKLPHSDERMKIYRPLIRSCEGAISNTIELCKNLSNEFWRKSGSISFCELMINKFEETVDMKEFINHLYDDYYELLTRNQIDIVTSPKLQVLFGMFAYSINLIREISDCGTRSKILGRLGIRVIAESYVMSKYLLKKEENDQKIWEKYKSYGIGHLKLILLKLRDLKDCQYAHVVVPLMNALVNEEVGEEFTDVDLRIFNNDAIRNKFIEVNEKEIFDIVYDYNSGFVHGLWGAVRESSLLKCANPLHQYHAVPNAHGVQELSDVGVDCMLIIKKHKELIASISGI